MRNKTARNSTYFQDLFLFRQDFSKNFSLECYFLHLLRKKLYKTRLNNLKLSFIIKDIDFLVANPMRLLELMAENENLISLSNVTFFVVDEYIQFRKTQTMDYVKQVADRLRVSQTKG